MVDINLAELTAQFRGRKLAELILYHVKNADQQQTADALMGLMEELPPAHRKASSDLLDFFVQMPQNDARQFFSADSGEQLTAIVQIARGFFRKRHNLELSDEDAFTVFNIVVQNYSYACHKHPSTKAAMQKAAGIGLLGRMLRR